MTEYEHTVLVLLMNQTRLLEALLPIQVRASLTGNYSRRALENKLRGVCTEDTLHLLGIDAPSSRVQGP